MRLDTQSYRFWGKAALKTSYHKLQGYIVPHRVQPLFYNYKWSLTFKTCESLYFIPVT